MNKIAIGAVLLLLVAQLQIALASKKTQPIQNRERINGIELSGNEELTSNDGVGHPRYDWYGREIEPACPSISHLIRKGNR